MTVPHQAPELAPYQDEPPQLPSGSVGKNALLRLRFEPRERRSILAFMDRRAPLLVQRALYCDEGMPGLPVVYIISNAGGILQGDRYTMNFVAAPGACGHVTTQAATKVHEMDANYASQDLEITVGEGAYFEYVPDPVIPFKNCRFLNRTRIEVHPTATVLYAETLMGGRKYYKGGERFLFDLVSTTVSARRPGGRELFTEKYIIEPKKGDVRRAGVMGDFDVYSNVVLLTPKPVAEQIAGRARGGFHPDEGWAAGVSRLPNDAGLVYKVLAHESGVATARVREFWSLVRPAVTGYKVPPEFPWR